MVNFPSQLVLYILSGKTSTRESMTLIHVFICLPDTVENTLLKRSKLQSLLNNAVLAAEVT
jgi:hypothetical protein